MQFDTIDRKGGKTRLLYTTTPAEDVESSHKTISRQDPEPEFLEALEALKPHVLYICELPKEAAEKVEVAGVRLTWKDSRMGAVIKAKMKVETANAPLNLSTPILWEQDLDEEGAYLPKGAVEAIDRLIKQAKRLVAGHTAQGDMFEREDAEPEPATAE